MSSRVLQLLPHALAQPQAQIVYGELARQQPAPASFASPMHVVIPDWSLDYYWTVTNWPVIHGRTLPAVGAACLLIFDNQGTLRCVWWDGAYT